MTDLTASLNALIAKCENATPGPRTWIDKPAPELLSMGDQACIFVLTDPAHAIASYMIQEDAELIAALSPEVVRALAECADELDHILSRYKSDIWPEARIALTRLAAALEGR
jgi:hypothetical protein